MDTITHALIGYSMYKCINSENDNSLHKKALLATSLLASQAPDFDVIVNVTETGRIMNQMWHRGITHSIFTIPVLALIIFIIIQYIFKVKDKRIFYLSLVGLYTHATLDIFNPWGTGYFEPFSHVRISIGTVPILDIIILLVLLSVILTSRLSKSKIYKNHQFAMLAIIIYIFTTTGIGLYKEHQTPVPYQAKTIVASMVPFHYEILGKKDGIVDIYKANLFMKPHLEKTLQSDDQANLQRLYQTNPKARVLVEWAPFVVVVNSKNTLGVYDPRIMNNGKPLNFEFIQK